MSLNWKEIDAVLAELDLEGAAVERVLQPSYDSIALGLYKAGREIDVLLSIAHGACRIHSLTSFPPKPERPLRFQECLKARIKGGRVTAVRQLGEERVVRMDIEVARKPETGRDETVWKPLGEFAQAQAHGKTSSAAAMAPAGQEASVIERYVLYARLWSGAGNILLVDGEGRIVDGIARRPARGELSGEPCRLEAELAATAAQAAEKAAAAGRAPRVFELRVLPPLPEGCRRRKRAEGEILVQGGSFCERLEYAYAESGGGLSRDRLLESARERSAKRRRALESRIAELGRRAAEYRDADRMRELGDILMANQHQKTSGRLLRCDDFFRGGEVAIEIDPAKPILDNAKRYYERYKKAKSGLADVEAELATARASLDDEVGALARLEAIQDPLVLARELAMGGTARAAADKGKTVPGLSLERKGWTILVGRSAKDNDELLRRHVRGSDLWMHARDFSGSDVFVKARAGKSFPLEIMIDAGNLAIYYSKGRANGGGELYYTLAKYLRRAKDGPKGLVIPTQEKNLHVTIDEARLRELKALMGEDE